MLPVPTQSNILAALRSFLVQVLPTTGPDGKPLDIILAQTNRIPEPSGDSFVTLTPLRFERIETNVDSYEDASFTGSIAGTTLAITAIDPRFPDGAIEIGTTIFGVGIAAGTVVSEILTGTGQIGTYKIAPAQTLSSRTLSAGVTRVQQASKATIQLDFHSADSSSADLAQTVTTLMRDEYATNQFANQSPSYDVTPLYASDARQMPFTNDQNQVENRWVVEAVLQANAVVKVPQQFSDAVAVDVISVEEAYAP